MNIKKVFIAVTLFISIISFAKIVISEPPSDYEGSSFSEVWAAVMSDEYSLPHYEVSYFHLFSNGYNLVLRAAKRTLFSREDILENMNGTNEYSSKLAHPNGICLSGNWEIDGENPYSGYFKKGSIAKIIVRASTALTNTVVGDDRAFGFAGKLFPTTDELEIKETANFFTVDDLGGTDAQHFTDVELTNSPVVSFPGMSFLPYAHEIKEAFSEADSHFTERQMYEVSELGEDDLAQIITPKYFKISARGGQTVDFNDFRDELNVENYNNHLVFDISVNDRSVEGLKWIKIGQIILNESVVSTTCDHRLHFHHPSWKTDLVN